MKKITLIAIAFVAVSFASCKKDYTCTCSYTGGGTDVTKMKTSKSSAQAHCTSGTSTFGTGGANVKTCSLSK